MAQEAKDELTPEDHKWMGQDPKWHFKQSSNKEKTRVKAARERCKRMNLDFEEEELKLKNTLLKEMYGELRLARKDNPWPYVEWRQDLIQLPAEHIRWILDARNRNVRYTKMGGIMREKLQGLDLQAIQDRIKVPTVQEMHLLMTLLPTYKTTADYANTSVMKALKYMNYVRSYCEREKIPAKFYNPSMTDYRVWRDYYGSTQAYQDFKIFDKKYAAKRTQMVFRDMFQKCNLAEREELMKKNPELAAVMKGDVDIINTEIYAKNRKKQERFEKSKAGKSAKLCHDLGYNPEIDVCGICEVRGVDKKLFSCKGCYSIYYCSKECQKSDWKTHKKGCREKQKQNKGKK